MAMLAVGRQVPSMSEKCIPSLLHAIHISPASFLHRCLFTPELHAANLGDKPALHASRACAMVTVEAGDANHKMPPTTLTAEPSYDRSSAMVDKSFPLFS